MARAESLVDRAVIRPTLTVRAGPRPLPELISLAAAASRSKTSLTFRDTRSRSIEDLMRLAVAGGESVSFRE